MGAYVSGDRGMSWQKFMTGLPNVPVHDLQIHPRDAELIAGTHGRAIMIVDNTQGADAVITRDPKVKSIEDLVGKSTGLLQFTPSHGMFMDAVTVMFISLPIFMPVVHELGWDPVWFGVLPIPDLLGKNQVLGNLLQTVHLSLNLLLIAVLIAHVGAALKHHFIDRDDVLTRMLPFQNREQ